MCVGGMISLHFFVNCFWYLVLGYCYCHWEGTCLIKVLILVLCCSVAFVTALFGVAKTVAVSASVTLQAVIIIHVSWTLQIFVYFCKCTPTDVMCTNMLSFRLFLHHWYILYLYNQLWLFTYCTHSLISLPYLNISCLCLPHISGHYLLNALSFSLILHILQFEFLEQVNSFT